ncbi:hypothetical protein [Microscilla marina]|nr:hypothetical protein [Microscilla marina]
MKRTLLSTTFALSCMLASCGEVYQGANTLKGEAQVMTASMSTTTNILHKRPNFDGFAVFDLSNAGFAATIMAPKNARVIPHKTNLGVTIYGGKYFKMQLNKIQGTAQENTQAIRALATDKDLNPSFAKLEVDGATGYLKADKNGALSFVHCVGTNGETVVISSGMPYRLSPDKFTAYTRQDVQLMWKSAKTFKLK